MKKQKEKKIKKRLNRNGEVIKNNNYGITLMALVITIIVLLILAGISIGMLSGDNSIIKQAGNAKKQTDISEEKEILQTSAVSAMGKSKYGDLTKDKLDDELDKNIGNTNYSSELVDDDIKVTFTNSGRTYIVDSNGNIEKAPPKIVVDENSLTITNTNGSSITSGQVEQGTALKISFNASVQGGTVTVSPSLPHTTTTEEIEEKSVTFTITANVPDETVEPLEYTVDLKKIYKSNVVSMEELKSNASKYFGYDVINYAQTLPSNLQDTEWQLFYAGALEGETEERIYLISKGFAKNTVLPAKDGATPIAASGSDYKATFGSNTTTGIMPKYIGSANVAVGMQKYNKDYFKDYTSTYPNMKAVAYMLDTDIWSSFATSNQNYAEWAIGGPTVELLFIAYNKYKGTSYESDAVSATGYQVRKTSSDSFTDGISNAIVADTGTVDNPYSVYNQSSSTSEGVYWLASPSYYYRNNIMYANKNGSVSQDNYFNTGRGFRPLVLLNSNFQLEKTTSGGKEVFKIVPKTE
ncbi:MAG: hypothetical protein IJK18_03390 [Clostridia bacterium]|nr:hypothetical protein [Clostridia bacterium]